MKIVFFLRLPRANSDFWGSLRLLRERSRERRNPPCLRPFFNLTFFNNFGNFFFANRSNQKRSNSDDFWRPLTEVFELWKTRPEVRERDQKNTTRRVARARLPLRFSSRERNPEARKSRVQSKKHNGKPISRRRHFRQKSKKISPARRIRQW